MRIASKAKNHLIIGVLVTFLSLSLPTRVFALRPESDQLAQLLGEARNEAGELARDADVTESLIRNDVSWQTHAEMLERVKERFGLGLRPPVISYGRNPELLDALWGQYFATGQYRPIWRIMTMLPWAKERDDIGRLTIGSAAKYTLASNAARYPDILALIKDMAAYQEPEVRPILAEVIKAAETTETSAIRREQAAMIERLKSKGAGSQQDMKTWGVVGQGAIGITCVVLATVSLSAAGLPCVIGGAATSAVLGYWAAQ